MNSKQLLNKRLTSSLASLFLVFIVGCEAPEGEEYKVEVNKPYYLKDKPDAEFIKNLDSLINTELIKDQVYTKNKIALEISANPKTIDPSKQNQVKQLPKFSDVKEEPIILTSEEKLDRFLGVLDEWSKDSENKKFYRGVRVKAGQKNIKEVLRANYGKWTESLPEAIIKYSLETQNRGVNLDDLEPGQMLRLPKL